MDNIASLSGKDRRAIFGETANKMDTVPAIAEKDFWVVWVLNKIFDHDRLKHILQFKGGTSLSKVFDVIGRFSEDIDLILDWREVVNEQPNTPRSKNQQNIFNEATNEQAKFYIADRLLPEITACLSPLCECSLDKNNAFAIVVAYPALYDTGYLRPEILLEIGPLAAWSPSAVFDVKPYVADYFPRLFERAECQVPTILAKRTFWEKATILHQEANRAAVKPMPLRYSRHYYDVALLAQSSIKDEALADTALLAEVVAFKRRFYPSNWAQYELATVSDIKLLPPGERMEEIANDYKNMQLMIFAKPLSIESIWEILDELEHEIHQLDSGE